MTKQQESEILTRVGPGTSMGNVLRHYWFPALKSSRLHRLRALGVFEISSRAKSY